jgi:hypothetical protein
MHIHLPKPLHGWREFLGEVGVIVIGVLVALGAEQVVENLHHRSQVHEATDKLHIQNLENQRVLDYDQIRLRRVLAVSDSDIAALRGCRDPGVISPLTAVPQVSVFAPSFDAWEEVRDGALLPLMPRALVDNYSKIDGMSSAFQTRLFDLQRSVDKATAAVDSIRGGGTDRELCDAALLALNELRQIALNQAMFGNLIRQSNEFALSGQRIDVNSKLNIS